MRRELISIPFSVDLTEEKSWEQLDEKGTSFFVVRFHFQLNERLIDEPHKVGDWIGLYQSTKGMSATHVTSETTNVEQVISKKCIENHLIENELLGELASELVSKFELPKLFKLEASVKSKISSKLKDSYTEGTEISESQKITKTESISITNQYPPEETEAIVSVPVYKRRAIDILLAYIDFLKVDYRRPTFGLRKKSKKEPPVDSNKHINVIKFGMPIATAYYWELMHNSSKFMYEKDHKVEVNDPSQITISGPICTEDKFVEFPDVPTLYQIAVAAFPHKWILRKSTSNEWTEETLKAIELDEVKGYGNNGWYKLYGNRQ